MIPEGFIAATLDYRFDYGRITREICSCREFFLHTPPYRRQVDAGLAGGIPFMSESAENYRRIDVFERGAERNELPAGRSFYLRASAEGDAIQRSKYAVTKRFDHGSWRWRAELEARIPYTIECIGTLPYRTLGLVRVFVCEDTFMPTHRDVEPGTYDKSRAVGISLVPATGGVGTLIWNSAARRVEEVRGNCIVFDDSNWHGVPMTRGLRITIRIFGELDFERLGERLTATVVAA